MHRLIYSIKMIALPFPQEAWQGDKILTYLFVKVSNEVANLCEIGLLGLFWREESSNRALFVKLLWHRKLCMRFNILERLISENFLLRSRVSHAQRVYHSILMSSHQVLHSYALLRTTRFDACTYALNVNLNGFAVLTQVCNHNSVNCILSN